MSEISLVIVGAGGLGTEYVWAATEMNADAARRANPVPWKILGYADDNPEKKRMEFGGAMILGSVEQIAADHEGESIGFAVAVGRNAAREILAKRALALGWHPATLIHPSVIVAKDAIIGNGSYAAPGSVICPGAKIGDHVIINTHASIGHHSTLGDFSQICPGARISGGAQISRLGFVGSNASVNPGVTVGEGAVVGANSHAVRRVAEGTTVIGCPAMRMGVSRHTSATLTPQESIDRG